jgi:hypothetical protein
VAAVETRVIDGLTQLPVGPEGRRFRDLVRQLLAELGVTIADLSAERYQLLRRAATLAVACEDLEARLASGEQIDCEVYSRVAQQQRLYFAGRDSPASTARHAPKLEPRANLHQNAHDAAWSPPDGPSRARAEATSNQGRCRFRRQ